MSFVLAVGVEPERNWRSPQARASLDRTGQGVLRARAGPSTKGQAQHQSTPASVGYFRVEEG